jgi:S-adenosyl methyltransferase
VSENPLTGGVRQFLDCGSGLPSHSPTHEVAQAVAPQARIVYVDHDPLVLAHPRALLESNPTRGTRRGADPSVAPGPRHGRPTGRARVRRNRQETLSRG